MPMAGFLLAALALAAQSPAGTRELAPGRGARGEAVRIDPIFRRTIACLVEREPSATRALLATISGTDREARIVWRFQSRLDHCLPGAGDSGIAFPSDLLRGAIAEIHYRRAVQAGPPAAPAPAGDVAAAWARPRLEDGRVTQHESFHAMARCVVLREPGAVTALLAAAPFSGEEMRAIRSLQDALSACIDPDTRFVASRQLLRGLLAEAAFHYDEAQRTGFAWPPPQ